MSSFIEYMMLEQWHDNLIKIKFEDCEHETDFDKRVDDLLRSGAKIASKKYNRYEQTGEAEISVPDKDKFMDDFKKTNSYFFSSLWKKEKP